MLVSHLSVPFVSMVAFIAVFMYLCAMGVTGVAIGVALVNCVEARFGNLFAFWVMTKVRAKSYIVVRSYADELYCDGKDVGIFVVNLNYYEDFGVEYAQYITSSLFR